MKTVTYRGPKDPRDRTTRYRIEDVLLPKGKKEEVSDAVAAELEAAEGQIFEFADAERQISPKARELAEEKGIDLDDIDGDDPIGVDDVRAAIDRRDNPSQA